jgi:hypothetical protein
VSSSHCPNCNAQVSFPNIDYESAELPPDDAEIPSYLTDTRSLPVRSSRQQFQVITPTFFCQICYQSVPLPGSNYSEQQTHQEAHDRQAQAQRRPQPVDMLSSRSLPRASPTFWCEQCFRNIPAAGTRYLEQQDHITAHEVGQQAQAEAADARMREMFEADDAMLRNAWNRYGINNFANAEVPYEPSGRAGLSAEEVRQVVEVDFPAATKVTCECVVCKEELHAGERVKILPCAHLFHPKCIDQWLAKHAQCPIDRMQLGYQ